MRDIPSKLALAALIGAALLVGGTASAQNREVTIVNDTSFTMVEFYASNTGTNDWEEDILGVDMLAAGESSDITIDDGTDACEFDFKATFDDGTSAVKGGVNVCEISQFDFTE